MFGGKAVAVPWASGRRVTLTPAPMYASALDGCSRRRAMKRRLIILDLNLPGLGGLELLRRLIQQGAGPILMLTMHAEPLYAKRALAGAAGDRDRGELRTFF
jgi:two-component system invasion response regulator UvrY